MLLPDCWIFSPKVDSSENLCFTIKIKKSDYNDATRTLIFDSYNQWKQLDLEVVWLQEKNDEIPKLRQRLALVMSEYAEKWNYSVEELKMSLYLRYNVKSRTELTRDKLEESIKFYLDWLRFE